MSPSEIDNAIQRVFDGALTEGECLELRAVLKSDPAARALYYEYAGLHQALIYRISRSRPLDTAKSLAKARMRLQTRRSVRLAMAAAAVVLIALGLALRLIFLPAATPVATFEGGFGTHFTVEHSGPERDIPSGELKEGSIVYLSQGTLEVKLRNGSVGIVLAPATFSLQSESRMFLQQGTAWFHVSQEDHGFQVFTPELEVTDLGTEFGVISAPDESDEVHVFSGRVMVRSLNALKTEETLTKGQARIIDPVGRLKPVNPRSENFLKSLPSHTGSSLIANGNFESGNPPPNATYGVPATSALLPTWHFGSEITISRASSDGHLGYGERDVTILSSTSDVQVAFNSNTLDQPPAANVTLQQTFITQPGGKYTVEFEMGAIFFSQTVMELTASIYDGSDLSQAPLSTVIERRDSSLGSGYNPARRFTFTATSDSTTLAFTETSASSLNVDPVIDNVSVYPAN